MNTQENHHRVSHINYESRIMWGLLTDEEPDPEFAIEGYHLALDMCEAILDNWGFGFFSASDLHTGCPSGADILEGTMWAIQEIIAYPGNSKNTEREHLLIEQMRRADIPGITYGDTCSSTSGDIYRMLISFYYAN